MESESLESLERLEILERFEIRLGETSRALETFRQIIDEPYSTIVRDAAIQRFEYTFEALWKLLKEYLKVHDGLICNSPKTCFREAFSTGILSEDEAVAFLEMTDMRNLTSHTYKEDVSQMIYEKLADYYSLMAKLMMKMKFE
ncbi:MAG: nucleotidyltransferase substrate binding protein [Nitrospirae bacterium]|nr:nucleotidyltransferase substrate binding protein [Nitrospirota bacterium]